MEYDRIIISEGVDTNETASSREYIICHYWCIFKINLDSNQNYPMVVII